MANSQTVSDEPIDIILDNEGTGDTLTACRVRRLALHIAELEAEVERLRKGIKLHVGTAAFVLACGGDAEEALSAVRRALALTMPPAEGPKDD